MFRTENRFGRFSVSCDLLNDWEKLLPLFGQMVVTRAECNYATRTIDYVAVSAMFEPVQLGVMIPEYRIICQKHRAEDGTESLTFSAELFGRDELALPLDTIDRSSIHRAVVLP